MKITLTKLPGDTHELRLDRDAGKSETRRLPSRSLLKHDFLHFCVECKAGLRDGFWGRLAAGQTLEDLMHKNSEGEPPALMQDPAMYALEGVVGALQRIEDIPDGDVFRDALLAQGEGLGWTVPEWLTAELVEGVRERMRRLMGNWRAIGVGESMVLTWDVGQGVGGQEVG